MTNQERFVLMLNNSVKERMVEKEIAEQRLAAQEAQETQEIQETQEAQEDQEANEYVVQLVDNNKSIVRHEIFKDEKSAFKKALKWHRVFPQNFICVNNAIVYKMGV